MAEVRFQPVWSRWWSLAHEPVDRAALTVWRVLFGLLMAGALVRSEAEGWIDQLYVQPEFHFRYLGWAWLPHPPPLLLHGLVALLVVLALLLAAGRWTRAVAAAFAVGFFWLESLDVTNYLNHYWLVTLLAALCAVVPWSQPQLPRWSLWLLRAQVVLVYSHAGLAKIHPDWLLHGQPLGIWLQARADVPLVGPWLAMPQTALIFAWSGMLYDTAIAWLLLWPRTRTVAMLLVLAFHGMTHVLFNIGIFPLLMTLNATLLLDPAWPRRLRRWRRWVPRAPTADRDAVPPWRGGRRWATLALGLFLGWQALWPLRHLVLPGDVLWNEAGMRFAWKVMLREKHGDVTLRAVLADGRTLHVRPSCYLDHHQEREMASQPDLILQMAHHVREDMARQGHGKVRVYADAWVSLNGRAPQRLIDPDVDLAAIEDGLGAPGYVLPAPDTPPLSPRARRLAVR